MISSPPPVRRDPLAMSVGSLCRRLEPIDASTSIQRAAFRFHDDETQFLPVTSGNEFVGILEERDLIFALSGGWDETEAVSRLVKPDSPTISPSATGAEALRLFESTRAACLAVVDPQGGCHGLVTPSLLLVQGRRPPRPRIVGGMATPFGVYLTNGAIGAGASHWALIVTGALLFGLFMAATFIVLAITNFLPREIVETPWYNGVASAVSLVLFLGGMRLLPLSGIHAAEHMVVHAIEQGEELEPEIVSRMSRIHPRCGTNFAAGAMLFLGLFGWNWTPDSDLRLLVAFLATLILWRPLGYLLQKYATTRNPTPAQVQLGIQAGKALMDKLELASMRPPTTIQRLLSSGLFHIVLGSVITQGLAYLVVIVLNIPPAWRPFEF